MFEGQEHNTQQDRSHLLGKEVFSGIFLVFTNTTHQVVYKDQANHKQSEKHGRRTRKEHSQHTSHQTSKQVIGGIVVIIVGIIIVGKSSQVFATNHAIKQPVETQSHQDYGTTFVMASLPSDPREDLFVKLDNEDITGLIENSMLRMGLALSQMMGWTFGYVDPSLLQRRSFPTSFSKWGCRMSL